MDRIASLPGEVACLRASRCHRKIMTNRKHAFCSNNAIRSIAGSTMDEKRIRKCTVTVLLSVKAKTLAEAENWVRDVVFPLIRQEAVKTGHSSVWLTVARLKRPLNPGRFPPEEPGRFHTGVDVYWEEEGHWHWQDPWGGMDSWIRPAIESLPDAPLVYWSLAPTFSP